MIVCKKSTLERQSLSEVKPGRGSAIRKRLDLQIVEQFHNDDPHCKAKKTLIIPSSAAHQKIQKICAQGTQPKINIGLL